MVSIVVFAGVALFYLLHRLISAVRAVTQYAGSTTCVSGWVNTQLLKLTLGSTPPHSGVF